uniref:Uncharacterized protein n=1 Tax=Anopheles minimus TaxID=112268 RepID=A0A182W9F6_9DIPT
MKQPMTKTQRLKNIFAKRMQRGGASELPEENITPELAVVDEQDAKLADGTKPAKDDQTLVYAELELKPAGGEISFVNKPTASNESTEYAEILYVQQQAGATGETAGSETAAQPQQPQQPQQQQQRHHSSEDNRPVIDVSIQKPSAKSDGGNSKAPSGGK